MLRNSKTLSDQAAGLQLNGKVRQIIAATFLGFAVVYGVGFLPTDIAHNTAHDTRHSIAFPCH